MARTRRRLDGKFKAKVALEAIRGLRTISEIAKQFQVHPNQVTMWKKHLHGLCLELIRVVTTATLHRSWFLSASHSGVLSSDPE